MSDQVVSIDPSPKAGPTRPRSGNSDSSPKPDTHGQTEQIPQSESFAAMLTTSSTTEPPQTSQELTHCTNVPSSQGKPSINIVSGTEAASKHSALLQYNQDIPTPSSPRPPKEDSHSSGHPTTADPNALRNKRGSNAQLYHQMPLLAGGLSAVSVIPIVHTPDHRSNPRHESIDHPAETISQPHQHLPIANTPSHVPDEQVAGNAVIDGPGQAFAGTLNVPKTEHHVANAEIPTHSLPSSGQTSNPAARLDQLGVNSQRPSESISNLAKDSSTQPLTAQPLESAHISTTLTEPGQPVRQFTDPVIETAMSTAPSTALRPPLNSLTMGQPPKKELDPKSIPDRQVKLPLQSTSQVQTAFAGQRPDLEMALGNPPQGSAAIANNSQLAVNNRELSAADINRASSHIATGNLIAANGQGSSQLGISTAPFLASNGTLLASLLKPMREGPGTFSITARLEPPALGHVDAVVRITGQEISVSIVAHTAIAHSLLSEHLDELAKSLGTPPTSVSISMSGEQANSGNHTPQQPSSHSPVDLDTEASITNSASESGTFVSPVGQSIHLVL